MPTPLTDADKVLRNDTGKDIVTQLTSIASSIATPASLVGLSDTAITTPTDGQELTYNSSLSKWNNKTTRVELTQQQYDLLVANNEDLPDVDYYITDAGGAEVVSSAPNISDVYNPNTTYNTGDLCIYNNVLYKCKTNSVTGAWDGTKWDRTTVDEVITSTKAYVDGLIKYTTKNANIVSTQAYSDFRYDDVSFSEIDRSKVIGVTVVGGPTNRPAFAILMDGSVTKVRVFANGYADGTSIPVRLAYLDN